MAAGGRRLTLHRQPHFRPQWQCLLRGWRKTGPSNASIPTGKVTQFTEPPDHAIRPAAGPNDRLYASSPSLTPTTSSPGTRSPGGRDEKTLLPKPCHRSRRFRRHRRTGSIYFLDDPTAAIERHRSFGPPARCAALDGSGRRRSSTQGPCTLPRSIDAGGHRRRSRYSWSFQIAADGTLNGEPFLPAGVAGIDTDLAMRSVALQRTSGAAEDTDGVVYSATPLGIQVAMQNGRVMRF